MGPFQPGNRFDHLLQVFSQEGFAAGDTDFPKIGEDIGAVPVLKKLVDNGHKIILATVRSNTDSGYHVGPHLDNAVQWFKDNNIPLMGVNENPGQKKWSHSPIVYANLNIDVDNLGAPVKTDRSISDKPFINWQNVEARLAMLGYI